MTPTPKCAFTVPLGDWLRGPLAPVAVAALASPDLLGQSVFDASGIRRLWERHWSVAADAKWGIWSLLSLAWWRERTG